MISVSAANTNRRQRDAFIDALMKSASKSEIDVQAESPTAPAAALLDQRLEQELARPDGLRRIAFAMHPVLKRRLDYHAIGRNNILVVDEITTGDVPFYDVDLPEFGALFIAGRGEPVRQFSNVKRVQFPTSALSAVQQVAYEEITIRRYPVFDRAKERVAIAVAIGEDDEILGEDGLVDSAANLGPNGLVTAGGTLNRYLLAEVGKRIMDKQLQVAAFLMHPVQYAEIWKWSANELDQVTLNKVVETGMVGGYFGAKLLVSTRCRKDRVYALTTADKLGRLPERKAVEIKIFDNVIHLRYDILGWEQIGLGIFNTAGVAQGELTVTV
jgi:hypothetical protein